MQPSDGEHGIIWRSYMSVTFTKRLNNLRSYGALCHGARAERACMSQGHELMASKRKEQKTADGSHTTRADPAGKQFSANAGSACADSVTYYRADRHPPWVLVSCQRYRCYLRSVSPLCHEGQDEGLQEGGCAEPATGDDQ